MAASRLVVLGLWLAAPMFGCRGPGPSAHAEGGDGSGSDAGPGSSGDAAMADAGAHGADLGASEPSRFDLPAPRNVNDGAFATAGVCATCHANADGANAMRTSSGAAVSPYELWQATMMANASRDPIWLAAVRAEVIATPSRAEEIEATCTRCHAPMAGLRNDLWGDQAFSLAGLSVDDDRGQFGLDGVSCASCHQIGTGDLGGESSYSGHPEITTDGRIYGPHASPFTMPMMHHIGFTPTHAPHTDSAAICSACHTLDTPTLAADGSASGVHYSEQATYLEWRASAFSTEADDLAPQAQTCQGCHMPGDDPDGNPIVTAIARNPMGRDFGQIDARSPYHQHAFVGGNTWVPRLLRAHADELRPRAGAAAFTAVEDWTRTQLASTTASVTIAPASREGDRLRFTVTVENLVGHKLPSGYPARRAWLDVAVRTSDGTTVFRSGAVDEAGRILAGDGSVLASELPGGGFEPHRDRIDEDAQVQIYETVMADADGAPTHRLLRADHDLKDNRLLPLGFVEGGPDGTRIDPVLATSDADFVGGSDQVDYDVLAPAAAGPYEIEVSLRYQPLSARHLAELVSIDAPEIAAVAAMLDELERGGERLARATRAVP